MLWYGISKNKNSIVNYKYSNSKFNKKLHYYKFQKLNKKKLNKYVLSYILPSNWHLIISLNTFKKIYYLLIYSNTYFFKIPINVLNTSTTFDPITKQLLIITPFINSYNILYKSIINSFYEILFKPAFSKLNFKGKGYYIYKNYRNTITPQFGYSHRLYLYAFFVHVSFLSKTTLILFGFNPNSINITAKQIFSWRPLNIFTGRGVRFSKQIIYKKSGKVSSYR